MVVAKAKAKAKESDEGRDLSFGECWSELSFYKCFLARHG